MIAGFIIGSLYIDEFIERKEKDGNQQSCTKSVL